MPTAQHGRAQPARRARHELHDADGADVREGALRPAALLPPDGAGERGVDAVAQRGLGDHGPHLGPTRMDGGHADRPRATAGAGGRQPQGAAHGDAVGVGDAVHGGDGADAGAGPGGDGAEGVARAHAVGAAGRRRTRSRPTTQGTLRRRPAAMRFGSAMPLAAAMRGDGGAVARGDRAQRVARGDRDRRRAGARRARQQEGRGRAEDGGDDHGQGRSAGGHGGQYRRGKRPVNPSPASPASLFFGPPSPPRPLPRPRIRVFMGETTGRARWRPRRR